MGRPLFCKVKSHRGETLNEPADDLADLGRTIDPEQAVWTTRCNQIVFSRPQDHSEFHPCDF